MDALNYHRLTRSIRRAAPSPDSNPLSRLLLAERSFEIEQALSRLTRRQRAIITRSYFKAETLRSIGKRLGMTHERVRQIRMIAERRLRYILQTP